MNDPKKSIDPITRISSVVREYPLSFEDCADILEKAAPLATVLTKEVLLKLFDSYTTQLCDKERMNNALS